MHTRRSEVKEGHPASIASQGRRPLQAKAGVQVSGGGGTNFEPGLPGEAPFFDCAIVILTGGACKSPTGLLSYSNMRLVFLLIIPMMFLALALVSPRDALRLSAAVKRRINGYVGRRASQRSARKLANQFRTRAMSEGCDSEMIEDILTEHLPKITRRLESKWFGEYLG